MGSLFAALVAFLVGLGFTAAVSFSNISPAQFDKATLLCETNGGLATLRSNMWNERTVICVNGATFTKYEDKQ